MSELCVDCGRDASHWEGSQCHVCSKQVCNNCNKAHGNAHDKQKKKELAELRTNLGEFSNEYIAVAGLECRTDGYNHKSFDCVECENEYEIREESEINVVLHASVFRYVMSAPRTISVRTLVKQSTCWIIYECKTTRK
jgi:hypothetical protein